jgi:hypothetical protein
VHALGQDLVGETKSYVNESLVWEQASATYIEPVYQKAKWLSTTVSGGPIVFVKGGDLVCAPSRNPDSCHLVPTKDHYFKKADHWIDLMVDLTKPGEVSFMSLDLGNHAYTNTLGEGTQCSLEFQSL